MKPLSETQKLNESRSNTERAEQMIFWSLSFYDSGNPTYYEDSNKSWKKWERDANGYVTYYEDSSKFWCRYERDAYGNETYFENSKGEKRGTPKSTNQ